MHVIEHDSKFYIGPFDSEEEAEKQMAELEPKGEVASLSTDERLDNLIARLHHHGIVDADKPLPKPAPEPEPEDEDEPEAAIKISSVEDHPELEPQPETVHG